MAGPMTQFSTVETLNDFQAVATLLRSSYLTFFDFLYSLLGIQWKVSCKSTPICRVKLQVKAAISRNGKPQFRNLGIQPFPDLFSQVDLDIFCYKSDVILLVFRLAHQT